MLLLREQWRNQAVWYNGLGAQTPAPKKGFLTFYLKIFLNIHGEECFVIQFT